MHAIECMLQGFRPYKERVRNAVEENEQLKQNSWQNAVYYAVYYVVILMKYLGAYVYVQYLGT